MKRARSKRNLFLWMIVAFILIILLTIYYMLGGFTDIEVNRLEPIERTVTGRFFEDPGSEAASEHRRLCVELVQTNAVNGRLTEVIYLSDSADEEEKGRFVGITVENKRLSVPDSFQLREYASGVRYAVPLQMHVIVQPRPPKIEALLHEKAKAEGLELSNLFFSLVERDGSRTIEGWAKE